MTTICSRGARLCALTLLLAGSGVLSAAAPFTYSRSAPIFPVEFEQSGSSWVARGPGYVLSLEGGNAVLAASDGRGHAGAIRMGIVGARKDPIGAPERAVPGRRNYLTGADPARWRTNVRLWEQVRFAGVLDGVDVVYHGGGRHFEYDLVIAPGVNAGAVEISFTGADEVELGKSGDLIMRTAAGDLIQRKPVAYQMEGGERREVVAAFRLDGTRVGFGLGPYDHSKPLIIDPIIDYATWFPGAVTAVAADGTGSAYMSGQVTEPGLPVNGNAYQKTAPGSPAGTSSRLYIARFSPDGSTLIYCTYLDGSGSDTSVAIVVDGSGNAVVGGVTTSPDFPVTLGSYMSRNPGKTSFVSKLSADGSTLLWSTFLPSPGLAELEIDGSGNVFALCNASGQATVTTPNAIAAGGAPRWLGKLDPGGAHLLYATDVPGLQANSAASSMAIGLDGTVWIGGTALGYSILTEGGCPLGQPPTPAVVLGIDPDASRVVANVSIGGSGQNYGATVGLDADGNIYLAGITCSPDFPGINSPFEGGFGAPGFVVKLDAESHAWLWTASLPLWPAEMATDPSGNTAVLVAASPAEALYYFDSSGNQIWATQYSGPTGPALTMDSQGRIYVGSDAGGTAGAWQSGQTSYNPDNNNGPAMGLMRISPRGGSLLVLPQTIWIDPNQPSTGGPVTGTLVFSTGGVGLPVAFTVSTTTPWLTMWGATSANAVVTPLPNWSGTGAGGFNLAVGGLQPGSYDGSVTITSPGFANSPLNVPVHVVIPPTSLVTAADCIPPQIVIVGTGNGLNTIGLYLALYSFKHTITSDTPWIIPTPDGTDALIDDSSLRFGVNTGQVTITVPGDPNSPYQVRVIVIEGSYGDGYGSGSPNLVAGPATLSFLAQTGDAPRHATVGLWGAARASFTAASEAPWLSLSPAAGTTPWILSVTADPSGLQPGTYSTHIDIASNQTANGGARIPVTLIVQNDVPFNVDPAAVAVRMGQGLTVTQLVTLNLTSTQPMTYPAGLVTIDYSCNAGYDAGTTPGQLILGFGYCESSFSGWTNLQLTTSGNDTRDVPVAILPSQLYTYINPGGIVNDATFATGPVAPGSIVAVFGLDLASSVSVNGSAPLPAGKFSLFPALSYLDYFGVFYQSPSQWNIQVPTDIQPGTYFLSISGSAPVAFTVAAVAPYIFTWGDNHGAVLNADYSLNTPNAPAAAGSAIMVYLTGQGAVNPPVPTRQAAPSSPLSQVTATTTATIDGASANVSFSGLAPGYVGLCQVNVSIPGVLPAGQHKLVISIGGVSTNEVLFNTN